MKRASPGPGREASVTRPRSQAPQSTVAAAAAASTALLDAASRLLADLEGVRQQAASKPDGTAGEATAAATPLRGAHHLGGRLLVAMSLIVGADYLSPISLLPRAHDGRLVLSLASFLTHLPAKLESLGQAAQVLLLYGVCCTATRHQAAEAMRAARTAAELLAKPEARATVERQLARLHAPAASSPQGGQQQQQQEQQQQQGDQQQQEQQVSQELPGPAPLLLAARQLQHTCWWRVADIGSGVLAAHRSPSRLLHSGSARLSFQQLAEVEAAVAAAAAALQDLEPGSPKGLLAAGAALAALQQPAAADELYMQALHAAQRLGSSYYELRAAAALLSRGRKSLIEAGSSTSSTVSQLTATARAATAVLVRSAPVLRQCEQGLPPTWWLGLRSDVARGWRAVTTAQAELNLYKLLAEGMPTKSPAAPISPKPAAAPQQQDEQQPSPQQQQPAPLPLRPSRQNQAAEQRDQSAKQQVQQASGHAQWEAGGAAGLCSNAMLSGQKERPNQLRPAPTRALQAPAGSYTAVSQAARRPAAQS